MSSHVRRTAVPFAASLTAIRARSKKTEIIEPISSICACGLTNLDTMIAARALAFWDYSTGQINASLRGLAPGNWTVGAHSACSASPSNTLSVTIR
jgi:hypothetical protein